MLSIANVSFLRLLQGFANQVTYSDHKVIVFVKILSKKTTRNTFNGKTFTVSKYHLHGTLVQIFSLNELSCAILLYCTWENFGKPYRVRVHNIRRERVSNSLYMLQMHCVKYRFNTLWCLLRSYN